MSSSSSEFGNNFLSRNFDSEKYVTKITADSAGKAGEELKAEKAKIQSLSDETQTSLKRNVFQHYEQFVEAAKDISYFAGELSRISQILKEQKSLMQSILDKRS